MSPIQTVRVGGVPEHFNLPWHLAIADNAFDSCGMNVEFVEYPGGTGAMTRALSDGDLDIALLLYEGAVTNILRGHGHRLVKIYVESPLIWGIHVAADSDIQSVEEIKNRVFAISRAGSGSHLIAIVDAAERGWAIEDMKFSKVGNLDGAREKLANGKVDVFLWEKFTTQPLVDDGEFRRVGERIVPWPAFVVCVRSELLNEQSQSVKQILAVVDQYCERFKHDPKATSVISERFNIKLADCEQWFEHVHWKQGFEFDESDFNRLIQYLKRVNLIDDVAVAIEDVWFKLS